jgi:hypothetical protein
MILLRSVKFEFVVLTIIAVFLSRAVLLSVDDVEGPNLAIVIGLAFSMYAVSIVAYFLHFLEGEKKNFLLAILVQIIIASILYMLV